MWLNARYIREEVPVAERIYKPASNSPPGERGETENSLAYPLVRVLTIYFCNIFLHHQPTDI